MEPIIVENMKSDETRMKLGILFYFSSQWMGGVIYVINLIKTLNFLDESQKPEITLFYTPDNKKFLDEIKYPYLTTVEWIFPPIIWGNLESLIIGKNVFIHKILREYDLDAIYPMHDFPVRTKTKTKLISWCADLQHKHYPEFFTLFQRMQRDFRISLGLRNSDKMVLSSTDVLNDFNNFFTGSKRTQMRIFRFVSVIEDLTGIDINDLRNKYKLPEMYFMVSNQFHKHKNHKVLLLALAKLKLGGIKKHLAITGKFPSAGNSLYLGELHRIIYEHNLHDQISFLGVIPRNEQMQIMKHAQAVLQPSLFEGWSTVIEDAKSLQVPVIASNLKVNIEQLGDGGLYFEPHNADELSAILERYPIRNIKNVFYEDYNHRIKRAAEELLMIFQ
ncbi:MAG: glycosyltransferase [Bacteroidales bacterium]|nr:glycosyltransferase [Bacteroidales bacterium]